MQKRLRDIYLRKLMKGSENSMSSKNPDFFFRQEQLYLKNLSEICILFDKKLANDSFKEYHSIEVTRMYPLRGYFLAPPGH